MDPSKIPTNPPTQHVPHHPTEQELATPPRSNVPHVGTPLPGAFIPAEFWLSLAIGLILIFMSQEFIDYLVHYNHLDVFYAKYTIIDNATGNSVEYPKSIFFLPQMGIFVFGIVLIFDALTLLRPKWFPLIWLSVAITVYSVGLNLFAVIKAYNDSGFQIMNALAIAFGGYIALYQWRLMQMARLR